MQKNHILYSNSTSKIKIIFHAFFQLMWIEIRRRITSSITHVYSLHCYNTNNIWKKFLFFFFLQQQKISIFPKFPYNTASSFPHIFYSFSRSRFFLYIFCSLDRIFARIYPDMFLLAGKMYIFGENFNIRAYLLCERTHWLIVQSLNCWKW